MPITTDPCGCIWDEKYVYSLCPVHKKVMERAERIAWKLAARRGISFEEAWNGLWERIMKGWLTGLIDHLKKTVP